MRKLIETKQTNFLECDNPSCDFTMPITSEIKDYKDYKSYINAPCPKCGKNLLTYEDYVTFANMMKTINWVNKYLSWITIFMPNKNKKVTTVKVHNGITIKDGAAS